MPKTGELSKLFEIDRTTLNYYVKTGLIRAETEENQYHSYSFSDIMALAFIRFYRGLDFTTEEIKSLLYEDSNADKLSHVAQRKAKLKNQILLLRFKQLLLDTVENTLSFFEVYANRPVRMKTEAYYFVRKKELLHDPFWLSLYRMAPFIEFSARFDQQTDLVVIPELFSFSGVSLKETWLEEFGVDAPAGSTYYPAREKCLLHFFLSADTPEKDLSRQVSALMSSPEGADLEDSFVFYLIPLLYDSAEGGFDCLAFFNVRS